MRSARSGDFVFPSAGAKTCEAMHRGIEGEIWAQCARASVRRCKEEHTPWGKQTYSGPAQGKQSYSMPAQD